MPTSKQEQEPGLAGLPQMPEVGLSQAAEGAKARPKRERKKKEVLEYKVVDRISKKIEIDDPQGRYHVWWGEGVERRHHEFETIEEVMDQHERVVLGYLGYRISLPVRIGKTFVGHGQEFLEMKGESQKMAEIGNTLLNLGAEFQSIKTREDRARLQRRLEGLKFRIGAARSAHKQAAARALEAAIVTPQVGVKMEKTGEAAKDIFERVQDTIDKTKGVIRRWNLCEEKRDKWEKILLKIYEGLIGFRKMMDEGKLDEEEKRKMVGKICGVNIKGKLKRGYIEWSTLITGLPYKERVEDPRFKRLAKVEEYVLSGDDEALARTLDNAIKCLWRVWDDRRIRFEGEKKEYLKRPTKQNS